MAGSEAGTCPYCGSTETDAFPDGSGACRNCGRAFRGSAPVGGALMGEAVDAGAQVKKVRERDRLGLLGVVGGLLGYLAVPALFLIGAAVNRRGALDYVADVVNTPRGALVCGGLSFLVVAATYALWAGALVWRGFPEKAFHLLVAGVLCTVAAAITGPGPEGAVGILGGILALLGGFLVWRKTKAAEEGPTEESSSPPPETA